MTDGAAPTKLIPYEGGLSKTERFRDVLRDVDDLPALSLVRYIVEEFRRRVPNAGIKVVDVVAEHGRPGWRAYVLGDFDGSPVCCEGEDLRNCLLSLMKWLWDREGKGRAKTSALALCRRSGQPKASDDP